MLNLKEFSKIGKSALIRSVGVQPNFKSVTYKEYKNPLICETCEIKKVLNGLALQIQNEKNIENKIGCEKTYKRLNELHCENCTECVQKVPVSSYLNEKNKYNIPSGSERLSKLQVKQFLLYHFMCMNRKGFITNIKITDVAEYLNCTTKTVIANNKRLADESLILYSNALEGKFNIAINGYSKYHLSAKEGGSGYLYLSSKSLDELLSIENVNVLRLEIRKILKADDYNIGRSETRQASFRFDEIRNVLPSYISYTNIIKKTASVSSKIFETAVGENAITFRIKDEYNAKFLISKRMDEFKDLFRGILEKQNVSINNRDTEINDLAQLSFEYGIVPVREALDKLVAQYTKNGKRISNLGGLVRDVTIAVLFQSEQAS